jgi:hypothetical protein
MNPPESKGAMYDLGYSDGYRDRCLEQVKIDLKELGSIKDEDWVYLSQLVPLLPSTYRKVLKINL